MTFFQRCGLLTKIFVVAAHAMFLPGGAYRLAGTPWSKLARPVPNVGKFCRQHRQSWQQAGVLTVEDFRHAINAAMTERRIKAVGTVTGANYGRLMRGGFANLDPIGLLEKISKQRTAEARGAEWHVDDLLPPSVEAGKKAGIKDIDVLEATDYYRIPRG